MPPGLHRHNASLSPRPARGFRISGPRHRRHRAQSGAFAQRGAGMARSPGAHRRKGPNAGRGRASFAVAYAIPGNGRSRSKAPSMAALRHPPAPCRPRAPASQSRPTIRQPQWALAGAALEGGAYAGGASCGVIWTFKGPESARFSRRTSGVWAHIARQVGMAVIRGKPYGSSGYGQLAFFLIYIYIYF